MINNNAVAKHNAFRATCSTRCIVHVVPIVQRALRQHLQATTGQLTLRGRAGKALFKVTEGVRSGRKHRSDSVFNRFNVYADKIV